MEKNKKPRKRYCPREKHAPALIYDFMRGNRLTKGEHFLLNEITAECIDRVMLLSNDKKAFATVDTACRHLYILSKLFEGTEYRQRLARLGRVAVMGVWLEVQRPTDAKLFTSTDYMKAFAKLWGRIQAELDAIYAACSRVELNAMEKYLSTVPKLDTPDGFIITPDDQNNECLPIDRPATTYINDELSDGRLVRVGDRVAWQVDDGPKLAITEPIFVCIDAEEGEHLDHE